MAEDIWAYVDPDAPNPPPFEEPKTPMPVDVNPRKKTFSALDEDEKEELRELRRMQRRKLEQYDRRRTALGALRVRIQETISRTNLSYTFDCDTVHRILVNLKQQLSPTDRVCERELIRLYQKVKAPPRHQNVEDWLRDFQRTYDRCRKLRIPDTEGDRVVHDFLSAVNTF